MEQRQRMITEQQIEQQELIAAQPVQHGDDAVAVYGAMVYRLAYARLQSRHDADDIFQEVFLRYVRRAPVFAGYEHGKAWFCALPSIAAKIFGVGLASRNHSAD